MQSLRHRGAKFWFHFHFQKPFRLRPYTKGSALPFSNSPINSRWKCMTVLDSRSLSVTACCFARWPGMGTGHAMSDMFHGGRLRRHHLSQANRLESLIDRDTFQSPCLCPNRHAVDRATLKDQLFSELIAKSFDKALATVGDK